MELGNYRPDENDSIDDFDVTEEDGEDELLTEAETTKSQSEDLDAVGGLIFGTGTRTGGDLVPLPYIILNLLILLIIIALIILEILKRRKKSEEIKEYVENIDVPTLPDPIEEEPEVVVVPEPVEEEIIPVMEKVSKEEVNDLISDKDAYKNIKVVKRPVDKTNCAIINIDTIANYFNAGEVVTLEEMKLRIPYFKKKVTYVKVLARGYLDKPLTVDADDFSIEAVKMIILTGGTVICGKAK
jgi:ribosomal protein L15